MQLNPYVHFDGRCEEAFHFYQQTFGGTIEMLLRYESMPSADPIPAEWRSKIGHAHLTVGDQVFMGCDAPPSQYQKPQGFSASIQVKDPIRSRADLPRVVAGRFDPHAHPGNLLGPAFWHADRPLRDSVDGQLQ